MGVENRDIKFTLADFLFSSTMSVSVHTASRPSCPPEPSFASSAKTHGDQLQWLVAISNCKNQLQNADHQKQHVMQLTAWFYKYIQL